MFFIYADWGWLRWVCLLDLSILNSWSWNTCSFIRLYASDLWLFPLMAYCYSCTNINYSRPVVCFIDHLPTSLIIYFKLPGKHRRRSRGQGWTAAPQIRAKGGKNSGKTAKNLGKMKWKCKKIQNRESKKVV